ncbi:nucleolar protein dao-5-like [Trichoplusia ni]|uniref:Nucleolar protein dao-5-like n=1 Tax=Trichoplusia ni TaxID=7111 RepID=A0A7E5WR87_TRINI|nr:nucleolar protein dao-5-like [Trichoplusia ni]
MSTRSGKRIHSVQDDIAPTDLEPPPRSERKTRNKRVKEKLEELDGSVAKNKKRSNYVSYPSNDEVLDDATCLVPSQDEDTKQSRALRKNALKELNPVVNSDVFNMQTKAKNLIRKSTRGKKVTEPEENEDHENVPTEVPEVPKKKSKKNKKATAVIEDPVPEDEAPEAKASKKSKKKKKKGKKTSSIIVEDIEQSSSKQVLNRSNMSVDSFHSAAGSPENKHESKDVNTAIEESKETVKHSAKSNKKDGNNTLEAKESMEGHKKANTKSKKRKSSVKDSAIDNISLIKDNLMNSVENILNYSNLFDGHVIQTRSSTKNMSNVSVTADDSVKDEQIHLNASKVNTQVKKRRSSIKEVLQNTSATVDNASIGLVDSGLKINTTIKDVTDKRNTSVVKEVENEDLNVSNKQPKSRKSLIRENTFDKSNVSIFKEDQEEVALDDSKVSNKSNKRKRSFIKDTTFDKNSSSVTNVGVENVVIDLDVSDKPSTLRKSLNVKNTTLEKLEKVVNTTFEKETQPAEVENKLKRDTTFDRSSSKNLNATYEKDTESDVMDKSIKRNGKKSSVNTTYDKNEKTADTTYEKDSSTSFDTFKKGALRRKSSIRDATFEKSNISISSLTKEDFEKDTKIISSSAIKAKCTRRSTYDKNDTVSETVNTTYEKPETTETEPTRKSLRLSQAADIENKLNTTFEKESCQDAQASLEPKSSLLTSDNSSEKSDISRISITSDDTTGDLENIVNTTPLLIESSLDESNTSKKESPKPQTPLKREGTFTKDGPEVPAETGTPTKEALPTPAAGCTPYHVSKSSQKKRILNVTRSLEKGRSSMELAPRLTRVMFCSPVDNPVLVAQERKKVIKSNLKGSNKSFIFDDSASVSRAGRKRSYTQNDAEDSRVKRSRLADDLQQSVNRLSRPRTASATAKLSIPTTPSKKLPTPSKPRSDAKSRTKLPNFAALHQKQFDRMESLGECQQRRARRARQLLTPTAPPGLLDRISPKNNTDSPKAKETQKPKEKNDTPTKKLPTLESLRPGFTRFGFKLNLDVNPFSIPSKTEAVPKTAEKVTNGVVPRPALLPSLAGATSLRREVAKLAVMREKSFTGKRNVNRNENRTIIKGVRTNRRFELQMKMRNID